MPKPYNILYLHSHDSGRNLQPYGADIQTPQIQRLADDGVVFRNAHCISPTCSPSRGALLTGEYPHQCGQWGLSNCGYPLEKVDHHIIQTLKAHGYFTVLMGVQHIAVDERDHGYDEVREACIGGAIGIRDREMSMEVVAPDTVAWLEKHQSDDRPWFLDVGVIQTHNASWRRIPEEDLPTQQEIDEATVPGMLPNMAESRDWQAHFQKTATALDTGIGEILDTLEKLGLLENTIIVNTTDHGIGVPFSKCSLHGAGLEVSLIIRAPETFRGGKHIHQLVTHLDVFPTLCDLIDIPAPAWLQGKNLKPLVENPSQPLHDAIFAEINVHGFPQPERSVHTDRFRLVRRWYNSSIDEKSFANCDGRPIHHKMHEYRWPQRIDAGKEIAPEVHDALYDLMLDPLARNDVSQREDYAEELKDMQDRLEHWMQETNDSFTREKAVMPAPKPFERPDPSLMH